MMQQRKQEEEFFKSLYAKLPDKIDELLFMLQNEVRGEKLTINTFHQCRKPFDQYFNAGYILMKSVTGIYLILKRIFIADFRTFRNCNHFAH